MEQDDLPTSERRQAAEVALFPEKAQVVEFLQGRYHAPQSEVPLVSPFRTE
jgi:hypothetical protein